MKVHPDIYKDYRVAKRAAGALAAAMDNCYLLQNDNGKPRVIVGKQKPRDFPTWLAAWSFLFRLRCDQIGVKAS